MAVIERGTTSQQRVHITELQYLVERVREAGIQPPAMIILGSVVRLHKQLAWREKPADIPRMGW